MENARKLSIYELQQSAIADAFSRICSVLENNNDFSNDSIMSIMNYEIIIYFLIESPINAKEL